MAFELPKLAYAYDALEPHIDENQIIRSLSHWSRKPFIGDRQNYEPQG